MLHPVKEIKECAIRATDGDIGRIDDVFFDDDLWTVRYLVVDTAAWLAERQVLISPFAVDRLIREEKVITVHSTRRHVQNSPDVDTHQPISRQYETAYARYYGYPLYWAGEEMWGASGSPGEQHASTPLRYDTPTAVVDEGPTLDAVLATDPGDVHLRSCNDVRGYHIDATDGEIGHIEDFLLDDATWAVRYLVVDTSNWWFGNKVLISPAWVEGFNWGDSKAVVNLSREAIRNAPRFDPDSLPDDAYAVRLHDHYGRPHDETSLRRRRQE